MSEVKNENKPKRKRRKTPKTTHVSVNPQDKLFAKDDKGHIYYTQRITLACKSRYVVMVYYPETKCFDFVAPCPAFEKLGEAKILLMTIMNMHDLQEVGIEEARKHGICP